MSFHTGTFVDLGCDTCGEIERFVDTDIAAALEVLASYGWITEGLTADPIITCPNCARQRACAAQGHDWTPWEGRHSEKQLRECRRCWTWEPRPVEEVQLP